VHNEEHKTAGTGGFANGITAARPEKQAWPAERNAPTETGKYKRPGMGTGGNVIN